MTAVAAELIERGRTLAALELEVELGLAGEGRLLLVEGEAGVGKTRVLESITARPRDARVLQAVAGQYEGDLAFGVARQLLGDAPFAAGGPVPVDLDVGAVLHDLHRRVLEMVAERPLLIVVDDLHWADPPSIRLLAYLARRLGGEPLAVLAGARTGSGDLAALREPALGARAIVLAPLSAAGSAELLTRLLGGRGAELAAACHRATGGNPFLMETLARSLAAAPGPVVAADPEALLGGASSDVDSWVRAQSGALGVDATVVLETIAVLGDDVPLATVARIAEHDEAVTAAALDSLVAVGLLRADGRGFAHPLVHAAVRGAMPVGRRALVTGRAARFLAAEGGDVTWAAALLAPLAPVGEAWAGELLRAAGEKALREGAPEEAAALWRRCLEEPLTPAVRFETTLALGRLECVRGEPAGMIRLEQAHELAPDPTGAARAALARGQVLQLRGEVDAKIALLEGTLGRLGDSDPDLAEEIEGELALLAVTAASVRPRTLPRLQGLLSRVEGGGGLANPVALAAIAAELVLTGRREEGLRWAREARERLGRDAAGAAGPIIASSLYVAEVWTEVDAYYEAVIADPRRSIFLAADAITGRGILRLLRGDVLGAEAAAREALDLLDDHIVQPLKRAVLADALVERDEIEAALETSAAVVTGPGDLGGGPLDQMLAGARTRALAAAGRHREAVGCGLRVRDFERAWGIVNPHLTRWREATALSLAALGEVEEARALATESLQLVGESGMPVAAATARRTVALLAPGGADTEELRSVAAALEGEWGRLERTRTLIELGGALRAAGDVEAARTELAAARELAFACSSTRLERRAREELLATGARPRRIALSGRAALTPAEDRVASLAATGLANPVIAAQLVISRRTVEMHLSNAYRKLGIESRQALPGALLP
jgi:DNA-binding CsgD family transcriptional regulator